MKMFKITLFKMSPAPIKFYAVALKQKTTEGTVWKAFSMLIRNWMCSWLYGIRNREPLLHILSAPQKLKCVIFPASLHNIIEKVSLRLREASKQFSAEEKSFPSLATHRREWMRIPPSTLSCDTSSQCYRAIFQTTIFMSYRCSCLDGKFSLDNEMKALRLPWRSFDFAFLSKEPREFLSCRDTQKEAKKFLLGVPRAEIYAKN